MGYGSSYYGGQRFNQYGTSSFFWAPGVAQYDAAEAFMVPAYQPAGQVSVVARDAPLDASLANGGPKPDRTGRYLKNSRDYFAAGKYRAAAGMLRRAVHAEPESAPLHLALGQALVAVGRYGDAAVAIRRGLDLSEQVSTAENDPLDAYASAADVDQHLAALEQHVEDDSSNADARFLLGYNLFWRGRYHTAIEHLDVADQLNPSDSHAAAVKRLAAGRQALLDPPQYRKPTKSPLVP